MAKYDGDGSWQKLFKQNYAIREFSTNSINTNEELQSIKSLFLQRGFFDGALIGYYRNNYIESRSGTVNYITKRPYNSDSYYAFLLGYNPRIGYQSSGKKDQGNPVRCVAKFFIDTLQPTI